MNIQLAKISQRSRATLLVLFLLTISTMAETSLEVHKSGRWLANKSDGKPVFLVADAQWIFGDLSPSQQTDYCKKRKSMGFNAFYMGLTLHWNEKMYGDMTPYKNNDPMNLNDDYFRYFKDTARRAKEQGMYVILEVGETCDSRSKWFVGKNNTTKAKDWGKKLGAYFSDSDNIIFCLGQDRNPDSDGTNIHIATGAGIAEGAGGGDKVMITYHPMGDRKNSSDWLHNETWLDFNGIELWGAEDMAFTHEDVQNDYNKKPVKPTFVFEFGYETRANSVPENDAVIGDYWIRWPAYTAVFSGSCGATYGHELSWQDGHKLVNSNLESPGAKIISNVTKLFVNESRPLDNLQPDQNFIKSSNGQTYDRMLAMRESLGRYAYVYLPKGGSVKIAVDKLSSANYTAKWFDPRKGTYTDVATLSGLQPEYTSPSKGKPNDWVLVLEAKAISTGFRKDALGHSFFIQAERGSIWERNQVDGRILR